MGGDFKPWQLALLVLLFPAVGAFLVCSRSDIALWLKAAALVWLALSFVILLTLRMPAGDVIIDAVPIS